MWRGARRIFEGKVVLRIVYFVLLMQIWGEQRMMA